MVCYFNLSHLITPPITGTIALLITLSSTCTEEQGKSGAQDFDSGGTGTYARGHESRMIMLLAG